MEMKEKWRAILANRAANNFTPPAVLMAANRNIRLVNMTNDGAETKANAAPYNVRAMRYNPKDRNYYAGHQQGHVSRTPNGRDWVYLSKPTTANIDSIAISTTGVIVICYTIANTITVAFSSDGVTWTERALITGASGLAGRLKFLNGRFFLMSDKDGEMYTSTDGNTWTKITTITVAIADIAHNGTIFCAIPLANTANIFRSVNGTTFTSVATSNLSANMRDLDWLPGIGWVCTAHGFRPKYSTNNGEIWTTAGGTAPVSDNGHQKMFYCPMFACLIILQSNTTAYYKSTDGNIWTTVAVPTLSLTPTALAVR